MLTNRRDAIYARYSSHKQDKGCSIEVQLEHCRKLAGDGAREYVDRAVTGSTMDRPQFNKMLADAESGKLATVFVYKFDRFGRDAHAHSIVADLEVLGVKVVSATEGDDRMARGIHLVVAEQFLQAHGSRVADAKLRRFREGRFHGGPVPFGYRVEDGRLVVDADEAGVVRRVYALYLSDSIGHKEIAKQLAAWGVAPRRSKKGKWSAGSVRRMLINPNYDGRRTYCQYEYVEPSKTRKRNGPVEPLEIADESLRIIDRDTFNRTQAKIERRKKTGVCHHQTRRFSRLLICGECDSSYSRRYPADRPSYIRWGCGGRIWDRSSCGNATWLRESDLVRRVDDTLADVFDMEDFIIGQAIAEAERLTATGRDDHDRAESAIADLRRQLDTLTERLADPDLTGAAKRHVVASMDDKAERLAELERATRAIEDDVAIGDVSVAARVRQYFDEARRSLAAIATDSEFNAFFSEWFGPMQVHADGRLSPVACADAPNACS